VGCINKSFTLAHSPVFFKLFLKSHSPPSAARFGCTSHLRSSVAGNRWWKFLQKLGRHGLKTRVSTSIFGWDGSNRVARSARLWRSLSASIATVALNVTLNFRRVRFIGFLFVR